MHQVSQIILASVVHLLQKQAELLSLQAKYLLQVTSALTLVSWGLVNFGVMLWLCLGVVSPRKAGFGSALVRRGGSWVNTGAQAFI
jgi:hypothetical protein